MADNHRLMIYKDQSIFSWHIDPRIVPNERLKEEDNKRVAYCIFHEGKWIFVNERINNLQKLIDMAK